MKKTVKGLLIATSALIAVVAALSLAPLLGIPVGVKTHVSVQVVGPNGYVYPPGFLGFNFGPDGTILVQFSNGTVINLTPTSSDFQKYFKLFEAPLKQFKPDSPLIPIPTRDVAEIRGWVVIRGVNITLTYHGGIAGTIMKDDKGYYVLYRWTLDNATLQKIEALNRSLAEVVPAYIEAKVRVVPSSAAGLSLSAVQVKAVQTTFTGYNYLGVQQYNVVQSIAFGYDGSNVVWESGSITCGGAGYSFYNTITANGVTYSGWGNLATPSIPVNAPSGYVYENTAVYFGINIGGSGIYGQVAGFTTYYYPYGSGWTYYVVYGSSSGKTTSYSGWADP
ncbi:MAG: hypothetical protein QXP98_05760 [Thermoproteus sp.]